MDDEDKERDVQKKYKNKRKKTYQNSIAYFLYLIKLEA